MRSAPRPRGDWSALMAMLRAGAGQKEAGAAHGISQQRVSQIAASFGFTKADSFLARRAKRLRQQAERIR